MKKERYEIKQSINYKPSRGPQHKPCPVLTGTLACDARRAQPCPLKPTPTPTVAPTSIDRTRTVAASLAAVHQNNVDLGKSVAFATDWSEV